MRKSMKIALGAGLLAVAALQPPDAVLARSGDRNLQPRSTHDGAGIVPIAVRLSTRKASATRDRPGGPSTRPGGEATKQKLPSKTGKIQAMDCQPPTLSPATKTPLPKPPDFCSGKVVKGYKYSWCFHCGGFPPAYGLQCVTCKAGYSWNAARKQCCKGTSSVPIPK